MTKELTQIKVTSTDFPKRFYRVIAIDGNPDLYVLGAIIGETIGAWFEHSYLFRNKKNNFLPDSWLDFRTDKDLSMSKYRLSDLGEEFKYEYDTGENYNFKCKVLKRKLYYEVDEDEEDCLIAKVVDGKGQGIFENDHFTLYNYLMGKVNPEMSEDDMENDYHMPMNMSFEKMSDFDLPLDIENMEYYSSEIDFTADHFKEMNDVTTTNDDIIASEDERVDEDSISDDILNISAILIFNDEYVGNTFRRLIDKYDIKDAHKMISKVLASVMDKYENNDKKFLKAFYKDLDKLK